ncbi:SulP family inorganic anion transporter [Thalassobacillus sp. C254]|uniref:SulP family inorganic anion transporter n=1 Tax=Thalassobacillus sp. C254 TaxID=1225341 RepID=UPI0006D01F9D|nr:sulfate permease [Thalassobacillus sp. C254]
MNKKQLHHLVPSYNKNLFRQDFIAGLTLFVMLIPQGMAYAMLAGVPPEMGLYASTIPLIIYAIFGSSKHLSVGPVAVSSLLVFTGVSVFAEPGSAEYISYVLILAVMVGFIQLLLGLFRAGFIVKFIPHSVLSGYTSAVAIVIGISQIEHILGINLGNYLQVQVILLELFNRLSDVHFTTVAIGLASILLLFIFKKIHPRIPGPLLIVLLSIGAVSVLGLEDTGIQIVGDVPGGFPSLVFPNLTLDNVQLLFPMALTIALIGFMESLAIAKAVASKEKYTVKPNKELKALGLANIAGSFFQSFPVNGSFSRTAVNHETGGATQFTSVITACGVLVTLLFFTSYFYYLPNAVLASIIIMAVYKLIDTKQMKYLFKVKPFEGWVWVFTFFVTLFVGIQWGIILGAVFTLLLLVRRSAKPNVVEVGYLEEEQAFRAVNRFPGAKTVKNVLLIRIDSNIHFANINYLEEEIKSLHLEKPEAKWIMMEMSGVNDIDTVAARSLEEIVERFQRKGISFWFANVKGQVRDTINKTGWEKHLEEQVSYLPLDQLLKEKGINDFSKLAKSPKHDAYDDYMI